MARLKSTTYRGSPVRDTGVGSSIKTRWLDSVARDLAKIYDMLTGENAETDTINHSGGGRGALLNLPLINQHVDRLMWQPDATKRGVRAFIALAPVKIPDGQTTYRLQVDLRFRGPGPADVDLEIHSYDSGWTQTVWAYTATTPRDLGSLENVTTITADLTLSAGAGSTVAYVAVTAMLGEDIFDGVQVLGWRLSPSVGSSQRTDWSQDTPALVGDPFLVATTIDETTGFDGEQIADNRGLDALVLTSATSWLGAMMEYVMGGVLPGNNARTVTDEWHHDQSTFASEPVPHVPIFSETLGAILEGGIPFCVSTSSANAEGSAPQVATTASASTAVDVVTKLTYLPDFDDAASPTTLKAIVLVGTDHGLIDDWSAQIDTGAGTSAAVFFSLLDDGMWVAEIDDIPYTAGALNRITLQIVTDVGTVVYGECQIVGWHLFFEE